MTPVFPFPAIVGQEEMKQALLIACVEPRVGGVLVFGDRGTAKSTAVRALAGLLPPIETYEHCPYNSAPGSAPVNGDGRSRGNVVSKPAPVVDLPLGVTEDRVVGALDIEKALRKGEKAFEPGLLARANRGFLYIDEVNLLEDHIVDLLLDVAATGENVVERDGLSVRHPAKFVLVGSGNPEEGELRPQLLDRFGLSVEVETPRDIEMRIEVVRRRDAFERDPHGFCAQWASEVDALRTRIAEAQGRIGALETPEAVLRRASEICLALGADGLRGELTLIRAARAAAALNAADEISLEHLRAVAPAALRHRLRRDPLDEAGSSARIERGLAEAFAA
ncbi:magnesium chelatase ATPase subunit I [Alkalicaulis satelles]|uniref:Mg-protoporphyrin IX chelatase n=1 Tax=Alkalicaulis satelles TaxID=2609175 RepID=A0A5M6ZIA5_9PROT|nr:magnesium chelatase ATPase subunit I [Alkalicaulis satelles]KAA5804050.1 magnesium chelatase ATPase subunit I [Alkalicaulis satelles]